MREIKFRAWDNRISKISKPFAFGQILNFCDKNGLGHMKSICDYHKIMQFTGLKDKNGKEIYEDDIVRILYTDSDHISHVGQVVFNDNSWEVKKHSIKYNDFIFSSINHGKYGFIEVVGNIYENTELLS